MKLTYISTDDGWDTLYDKWVLEGRPAQFEVLNSDGGRLYIVLNWRTDNPTFLVHVADGPTEVDEADLDKDGAIKKKGYHFTFSADDGVHFRRDGRGKITIRPGTRPLEED